MSGANSIAFLEQSLPFSAEADSQALELIVGRLLQELGLDFPVKVVYGRAEDGTALESGFRRHWWATGEDAFRAALQRKKWQAHTLAGDAGLTGLLTARWRTTVATVSSESWRAQLRQVQVPGAEDYYRRAFRAAQQAWTRAARWEIHGDVASAERANPFLPLAEAFRYGAWPLGCARSCVWVFVVGKNDRSAPGPELAPGFQLGLECPKARIYASAEFEPYGIVEAWKEWLCGMGWELIHQSVDENNGPPEVQLGRIIGECAGVLGLANPDPDFGLPWWVFQELDFAGSRGTPVMLAGPRVPRLQPMAREVEQWLETLRRRLSG